MGRNMRSGALQAHDPGVERRNSEFDSILLSSIMKVSLGVFGQDTAEIVISYMEYLSGLKREDIAARIELFKELLGEVLGSGAAVVERLVVKEVYSRLGMRAPEVDDFLLAVSHAKNAYARLKGAEMELLGSPSAEG
ncbi:MAG: hypothetical protein JTT11_03660 [Candidatus Brockarchaeota archaeon]|nr:hypothetical protein [Candidatus Brockarchaeota archaeon]